MQLCEGHFETSMYFPVGCFFALIAGSVDPLNAIIFADVLKIFSIENKDEQMYDAVLFAGCFVALGAGALISSTLEVSDLFSMLAPVFVGLVFKFCNDLTFRVRNLERDLPY